MSVALPVYRVYELPWSANAEQEEKFRELLKICLGTAVVLGLLFAFLPLPEKDPTVVEEIPERFARLVIDKPPPPPPPPVVREPEPEPIAEPEPIVEQRVVEPEPQPEPVVREPEPQPEPPPPVDRTQQARERASVAGLLPFAQELAALRDTDTAERLSLAEQVGTAAEGTTPVAERSLITSRVGTASGGINTAALSRNTGGGGLAGRATTQVESPVAAIGDDGGGGEAERSGQSAKPSRSREEIERVFDRNKGAIYALYNRALRSNPALEGKVVLRLTIAPDGRVTHCEIVSSELNDADLEQRLVQRVLLFQFDAKDVEAITTTKPIDFFPA